MTIIGLVAILVLVWFFATGALVFMKFMAALNASGTNKRNEATIAETTEAYKMGKLAGIQQAITICEQNQLQLGVVEQLRALESAVTSPQSKSKL